MKCEAHHLNANSLTLTALQQSALPDAETERQGVKVLDSVSLFGSQQTLHIRHGGDLYCLRVTKLGKLILTK